MAWPTQYDHQKYYPGSPAEKDLLRPVREVRAEQSGADLFPYFGQLNDWINPGSFWSPNFTYEMLKPGLLAGGGPRDPDPVKMTFKWDGHEIHTAMDTCQAGDDAYCYANGWMKNQDPRLEPKLFNNYSAYLAYAKDVCREHNEKYDFDKDGITVASHMRETNDMYVLTDNACNLMTPTGRLPTDRDYQKHSYFKCLMNDALSEIGYCYFRGCVMENDRIVHGEECGY
jgi:hypothetical protein